MPAAFVIQTYLNLGLQFVTLGLLLWAFVDSAMRRSEAFPAIGTMPKVGWMLIFALAVVLVLVAGFGFFAYVALGLTAYYLLDVRRGLREVAEGPW